MRGLHRNKGHEYSDWIMRLGIPVGRLHKDIILLTSMGVVVDYLINNNERTIYQYVYGTCLPYPSALCLVVSSVGRKQESHEDRLSHSK